MHRWCQSLVAEGCGDDGAGVGPQMAMQGPLPEIRQKLRYAQPHPAPLTNPSAAPATCAVVWECAVLHGVVNGPRIYGMQAVKARAKPSLSRSTTRGRATIGYQAGSSRPRTTAAASGTGRR